MSESSLESGTTVSFRLSEVVCPDLQQILTQMTSELEVSGRVVFFSDYGDRKNHFAIIDVTGLLSPLIVPVSRLRGLRETEDSQAANQESERG